MADQVATPYGPIAGRKIDELFYSLNGLVDPSGADVLGTADGNPDPNTLLGQLKIMNSLLAQLVQLGGGTPGGGGGNSYTPSMDFSDGRNSQMLGG